MASSWIVVSHLFQSKQHHELRKNAAGIYTSVLTAGVHPIAQALLEEILSAPPSKVNPTVSPNITTRSDARFGSRWDIDGDLPELDGLKVSSLYKPRSRGFEEAKQKGKIVLNPYSRSDLEVYDHYTAVPEATSLGTRQIRIIPTWIGTVIPKGELPGFNATALLFNGKYYPDTSGSSNLTTSVRLNIARYEHSDLGSAIKMAGLTTRRLQELSSGLRSHVLTSGKPGLMITSTVADLRGGVYDVLTDLAEAKSSVQTLMSCVLRFLRAYTDTLSSIRNLPRLKGRGTDAASTWLEFRYGITPIVLSANSALDYLRKRKFNFVQARGRINVELAPMTFGSFTVDFSNPLIIRAYGRARVPGITAGLKINPLRTALEVVPMSLILNWFTNIGDVLTALWPPSGADIEKYTLSHQLPLGDLKIDVGAFSFTARYGLYHVRRLDPVTDIRFETGNFMSWRRFIDAFAFLYRPIKAALRILLLRPPR